MHSNGNYTINAIAYDADNNELASASCDVSLNDVFEDGFEW